MTTLTIVRHGNTFDKGETVVRVGLRTDLPLSVSGKAQAKTLGHYFKEKGLSFDEVVTSELKRTIQTGQLISDELLEKPKRLTQNSLFNEIDYGPDEAKTEDEVISRIGKRAIQQWDEKALVPPGWSINPAEVIAGWHQFAADCTRKYPNGHVLVVTSNGIARFAPYITGDFVVFCQCYAIKLKTGSFGCFQQAGETWKTICWGERPEIRE